MSDEIEDDGMSHLEPEAKSYIASKVIEVAEDYAASVKRSRGENKKRAKGRETIDKLGVRTDAFQHGLRLVKDLTINEQKQYLRDLKMVISVVGRRQMELFPEDALRAKKREDALRAKEADAKAKAGVDADTSPRSDPKSGGAGGVKGRRKARDKSGDGAVKEAIAKGTAKGAGSEPGKMKSPDDGKIENPPPVDASGPNIAEKVPVDQLEQEEGEAALRALAPNALVG